MNFFYQYILRFSYFSAWIISFFHSKTKKWIVGQQTVFKKLETVLKQNKKQIAWFHCASLGEYEQAKPVIASFKKNYPDYQVLITFFSPSGHENVQEEFVFFLPLDTYQNTLRFIEIVQPKIAFFVKYEFWPNYLSILKSKEIQTISFSAIFRPNQVYFKYRFFREVLSNITIFFVQNESSKTLLESIDINSVIINSDTRFDSVLERKNNQNISPLSKVFSTNQKTFVFGSIYDADMKFLIPFINQNPQFNYLIFPHEINHDLISKWGRKMNRKITLFSENQFDSSVIFVDKIGLLADAYRFADYSYIGGGFGKGIHNILEAAVYGISVFFGNKNYSKFDEANNLIALKTAFVVKDTNELTEKINHFERNSLELEKTSEICNQYFLAKKGATARIMAYLKQNNF